MDFSLWKEKGELKKYIQNLGIEYRYGCYEEKNPQVCHLLGDFLLSIDEDFVKAAETYEKNCTEYKHGLSCDAYGRMAMKGQGMPNGSDKLKAFMFFEQGCKLGESRSCYHAGQMLTLKDTQINEIIKPDPERGTQMLQKSCLSGNQPVSCTLLHTLFLGSNTHVEKNMAEAARFGKLACHSNQHSACYNLSRMYHLGDGVEQDIEMARYYRARTKECMKGLREKVTVSADTENDNTVLRK